MTKISWEMVNHNICSYAIMAENFSFFICLFPLVSQQNEWFTSFSYLKSERQALFCTVISVLEFMLSLVNHFQHLNSYQRTVGIVFDPHWDVEA